MKDQGENKKNNMFMTTIDNHWIRGSADTFLRQQWIGEGAVIYNNYNMFIPFPLFYFVTPYESFKQSFLYSLAVSVVVYSVEPDGLPD